MQFVFVNGPCTPAEQGLLAAAGFAFEYESFGADRMVYAFAPNSDVARAGAASVEMMRRLTGGKAHAAPLEIPRL